MNGAGMKPRAKKARRSSVGTCRLCLQERELCRSHIIPEFLYRPSYNAAHQAHELTVDIARRRPIQTGYWERLFCQECEKNLNLYDDYFASAWFQSGLRPTTVRGKIVSIPGLDYKRFKLFHMSVLWRAGISSRPEFETVRLGPHEGRLRRMLLAEDPGEAFEYPFWGLMLNDAETGRVYDDVLIQPEMSKALGHTIYHFMFGGCSWYYITSTHPAPKEILPAVFDRSGILILGVQDFLTYTPIVDAGHRYRANSKVNSKTG